ncbi:uncharacterized protein LOC141900812 isoform X3 [Tubulanus polymorphus]|uniref:uncharacterized protein LOC141900812 isoform X3 n=1 Tax=Tubulanus polymorphus TaxID=672921 RepID=UPI003DA58999
MGGKRETTARRKKLSKHSRRVKISNAGAVFDINVNKKVQEIDRGKDEPDDSSTEVEDDHQKQDNLDFDLGIGMDISGDDKNWDTDLEVEEKKETYDHTGRSAYVDACKKVGVIPASYFLRHMHDVTLEMKHHGLGAAGIKPICVSLVSNTNVQTMNLSDNWLGPDGGSCIADMLKENCFISHLDLSDNRLGNAFATSLVEVLHLNTTITKLVLAGNNFDDKAALSFADSILNTNKIEHLDLSHNNFGEAAGIVFGPAIAENASISHLDLSWNHIRRKGAVAVAQGVKNNIFLKLVNLSWNGFGLDGASAIGDALKGNSILEALDISNNRINPEGAVNIGKGLSINEALKVLKMGKNPMQTAGCYAICAAIMKNANCVLKDLDFSDILVNQDFHDIYKQVKENLPELTCKLGSDGMPEKPKFRVHPMIKLKNYIEKQDLRLVDVFNKWDKDKSMSVTVEEFIAGVEETGIKLTKEEIEQLVKELDKDGDGEINYSELVIGHTDSLEKENKLNQPIRAYKPSSAPSTRSSITPE